VLAAQVLQKKLRNDILNGFYQKYMLNVEFIKTYIETMSRNMNAFSLMYFTLKTGLNIDFTESGTAENKAFLLLLPQKIWSFVRHVSKKHTRVVQ